MSSFVSQRVHKLLQRISLIIPTASTVFAPIISKLFPHKTESTACHSAYLSHMLLFIDHTPVLRDHILSFIIDRLLKIDVEIQIELDDLDQDDEEFILEEQDREKRLDDNGDSMDELDADSDLSDNEKETISTSNIKKMVLKMDTLMAIMMAYIDKNNTKGNDLPILFKSMLVIFENNVILTHKSKYTQYSNFIPFLLTLLDSFGSTFALYGPPFLMTFWVFYLIWLTLHQTTK